MSSPKSAAFTTPLPCPNVAHHGSNNKARSRARILKVVLTAILGIIMFNFFARSFLNSYRWGPGGRHAHGGEDWSSSDGETDRCVDWTFGTAGSIASDQTIHPSTPPLQAKASFYLPVASELLFIIAEGSLSYGTLNLQSSDEVKDDVRVEIIVQYYTDEALTRANVCSMHRGDGENGIGIFTPKRWYNPSNKDQLRFNVTVYFPAASANSPLDIKRFDTKLPIFTHEVANLVGKVHFRDLYLRSTNGAILAESLFAERAIIHTTNGGIMGSFNSSESLLLSTTNGRISASVKLSNANENRPTELKLGTANGMIDSDISLYSTARESGDGGAFRVSATTSNGPVSVRYPSSPIDSLLFFDAKSSNAPVNVWLHPAYEGSFELQSSIINPSVSHHPVSDPADEGRERSIEFRRYGGNIVEGDVYWSEEKKEVGAGAVRLRTSVSPVTLYLH